MTTSIPNEYTGIPKLMVSQWTPADDDVPSEADWTSDNIKEKMIELVYMEDTKGVLNLRFSDSVTRKILINA